MAYYGFRAIIVLFLIDQSTGGFGWSTQDTLAFYGTFTAYIYLSIFLGGFCADFVLGAYKTTLLGGLLLILGYAGFYFTNEAYLNLAIGFIIVGCGLFKPNIPVMITHQFRKTPERFDSAFTGQYLGLNLGAAMSGVMIGYMAETFGWRWAFLLCAVIVLMAIAVMVSQRLLFAPTTMRANIFSENKGSLLAGLGVVFLGSVLATIFWALFELGSSEFYGHYASQMKSINALVNPVTVVFTCVVTIFLWRYVRISSWYKVACSFFLFALGWLVFTQKSELPLAIEEVLLVVMVIHAVAEVLFSAIFLSLIARYGYLAFISSSFAIFYFANSMANYFSGQLSQTRLDLQLFVWLSLSIGALLLFIPLLAYIRNALAMSREKQITTSSAAAVNE